MNSLYDHFPFYVSNLKVRVDGTMKKLDIDPQEIYDTLPTFDKILLHISKKDKTDSQFAHTRYTELLKEIEDGKTLPVPDDL